MKRDQIKTTVLELISEHTERAGMMQENLDLFDDLGMDSLDHMSLIVDCEDAFEIEIVEEKIFTVKDLVNQIEKALKAKMN